MKTRNTTRVLRRSTASALLTAFLLLGCGQESPEAMLASAKEYLGKNDHKAAVIQLKNALQQNPQLGEARFLLGKALLEGGDATGAEVELRKAKELAFSQDLVVPLLARTLLALGQPGKVTDELAKEVPTTPEAKADLEVSIGQAHLMNGQVERGSAAFAEALAAVPGYPPALLGQARLKASQGDFPAALALLDGGLEKSPKLYEAWFLKGDLLAARGDSAGAMAAYQKTLEVKPEHVGAHGAVVRQLLTEGKFEEAQKQLAAMTKLAPNHPQTTYLRALYAYQKKDYAAAKEAMDLTLKRASASPLVQQLAGLIEYERKAYTQAEAHLLKALSGTPPLGLARRALIASYLRSAQPDKAMAILQPVIDKIDQDSNMLALAGQVFMQNGQAEKAAGYFAKAAALDPKSTAKRTSLAMVNLARGDTEGAFHDLEQIASVDTGNRADLALIAAHLQRREFDRALKAITVLEAKQPSNPLTHNLKGTALLGKRDVAGARKSFEKAVELNPAFFPATANLASLDLAEKKPDEARKRFETLVAKDPKSVPGHLALADMKAKAGGAVDEVAALINKAVAANPNDSSARIALVGFYLGKREMKKALTAAQEAAVALPDRAEILEIAGRAQFAAKEYNQAQATYSKLAALVPTSPLPYLRMADVEVAAKHKDAAMEKLRKALEIAPDSLEAKRAMMMLLLDAGRTQEAVVIAREMQKQRPKEVVGYILEGDAHATKTDWGSAVAAYRAGLKQLPGASELGIRLHAALLGGGNTAEAEKLVESWGREHPKDNRFRLYLAEAASARKDYAGAARIYRALLDAQPENPALLNNLAWVAGQLKDPKAIEYAEKANRLAPNSPALMDTLGMLLVDRGEHARGLDLLKKAVEAAPGVPLIRLNRAKALIKAGQKGEARGELEYLEKLGGSFPGQAEVAELRKGL